MNVETYDTWVGRCNPLTKLVMVLCFGVSTAIFPNPILGLALLIIILALSVNAHIFKPLFKMMLGFGIPISIMLFIIQGCYGPNNHTYIADFGFVKVGLEGILYGTKLLVILLVFLGSFYLFNKTIYLGKLSASLTAHHVNAKVIYMLLASLNIVPEMQRQLKIVRDAQEARGLIVHKSLLSKVTAFIPLIGPVILSSLVNYQQRGMSLELKGLSNLNVERTSLIVNQDKAQDKVIRGALWIFLGIIIIVSVKMRLK